jgi:endo-1,4-beta-D-glucanase Y
MGSGDARLPTDWMSLSAAGKLTPAKAWAPRMSYDAIRIPRAAAPMSSTSAKPYAVNAAPPKWATG